MEILFSFLAWWVPVEVMGLAALPLTYRLFSRLPDRGYGLSRALGLLLTGYVFWIVGHFVQGSPRVAALSIGVVALASGWAYRQGGPPQGGLLDFLRRQRVVILSEQWIFALAFLLWTVVRAFNPEIAETEKPMEITFLNATLTSTYFPPHDPWLSGYAISYYYFGYVLMSMLAQLSGLSSAVAFNLGIALLFGLTAGGAFSLAYNLVASAGANGRAGLAYGMLGSAAVALIGNLEAVFEVIHNLPLALPEPFWAWLDIKGLSTATLSGNGIPTDHWWWWRASRVVHDMLGGESLEVIDEFPFFSFLLGDMHPHVLALPFVFLALGLAFQLLLQGNRHLDRIAWIGLALVIGGLGFLNSWELPTYGLVVILAYAAGRWSGYPTKVNWIRDGLRFALFMFALALILYLPFWISFRSQASGLLPVLLVKTRLHQFVLMFGLFLYVAIGFLIARGQELASALGWDWGRGAAREAAAFSLGGLILPQLMVLGLLGLVHLDAGRRALTLEQLGRVASLLPPEVAEAVQRADILAIAQEAWLRPLGEQPWLSLVLVGLLGLAFFSLRGSWERMGRAAPRSERTLAQPPERLEVEGDLQAGEASGLFATLLLATGLVLALFSEFFYVQDVFGTRMNTVFKLYYQAWVALALAACFGLYYVSQRLRHWGPRGRALGRAWLGGLIFLFGLSLIYPALSLPDKTASFSSPPTLDGMAFLAAEQTDDYRAIQWLQANVEGAPVILEATGDQYSYFGRVSAFTGLPTVLGWLGHETQWGRTAEQLDGRERAIDQIYTSPNGVEVNDLLNRYGVEYIYVGSLELDQYGPQVRDRFRGRFEIIYENEGVTIYRRALSA